MALDLRIAPTSDLSFTAAYSCPCGCTPSVAYARGEEAATDSCCCGNEFAVGPGADARVREGHGFRTEHAAAASPWGEAVPVAWAIGPSTHDAPAPDADDRRHGLHDHDAHEHRAVGEDVTTGMTDPVCGMTVDPDAAREKGLLSQYKGNDYFFCGKGCKLEFDDDPEHYLDPAHVPSM